MKTQNGQPLQGKHKGKGRQQGMIMIAAVVMLAGLMFVATTASINSIGTAKVETTVLDETRTFYAAEAGVEWGSQQLKTLLQTNLDPSDADLDSLPSPSMEGYVYDRYEITKVDSTTQETISTGDYRGLIGFVTRYQVDTRASSNRTSTEISREIQHQFIPLFQFGVFYDEDLEIFPGPAMTFEGRVHTNADLYIGAESGITCNSYVTAGGTIWHHRKDGGHVDPPGPVNIRDQLGVYRNMWRGAYWLDNRRADWDTESISVWQGQVRDRAHGMSTLRLPLPPAADQHEIVERADTVNDGAQQMETKYWYKAGMRYVDGVLTDSAGNALANSGYFTYTVNKFYDDRENRWMDVIDINISAMLADTAFPDNGIIYVSDYRNTDPAVRVKNASRLPSTGLTIATDLPLYVWGNYNTLNKRGSALLCDAITFLSPNWNDANSNLSLNSRIPSNMSVNACIMTGHVPSVDGGSYSGGLENLLRFLEKWGGTVTYRGSIIDLWFSRRNVGAWSYGSYYTAPSRNWGFDTDLLIPSNWPPGTPRVHTVQRGAWRQIS
ncbi:MAG: hypothetical protein H6506_00100 [Calditrichaeota bacterium]|nr:hypothetical protein [Calditrichota bacterium]MCB9391040.1 hypothetical protein [Calditrichota bacterium]